MKRFLKWLGIVVVSFIAIVVFAMIYVYFASEREFARQYQVAETLSVSLPTDAAEIEEGHRLAHITGCTHCHGANLAEPSVIDIPGIARFVEELETVLKEWQPEAMPVHVLYPANRHLSTKVRVFVDWVAELFSQSPCTRLLASGA